jgi:hypothetical protein
MQRYISQPASYVPRPGQPAPAPARQVNHAEGWRRVAIVFAGAAIGGFVVWPLIRPVFVDTPRDFPAAFSPMTPDGRPNNHTGMVPYGYPGAGDSYPAGDVGRAHVPIGMGNARQATPDAARRCRYDGRRLACDDMGRR